MSKEIRTFDFLEDKVISISEDEIVLNAFKILYKNDISGCPIVNSSNQIVGSFSTSDIPFTVDENIEYMTKSLSEMMKKFPERLKPIVCYENESLESILEKMVKNRIHRIFMVDQSSSKLKNVITLTDLISFFSKQKF